MISDRATGRAGLRRVGGIVAALLLSAAGPGCLGCQAVAGSLVGYRVAEHPSALKAARPIALKKGTKHAAPHPYAVRKVEGMPPVAAIKPVISGPGIVVCEPVVQNADTATAEFGTGCARWLHFTVGGHAELGKTPAWESVGRAEEELGRSDLRLPIEIAAKLSDLLGITHVAVGTISGHPTHCTLTYQLWQVPARQAVGAPLTASGTQKQVIAALPLIARKLLLHLGVTFPHAPASVAASPKEVRAVGQVAWEPLKQSALSPHGSEPLEAAAEHWPLASFLSLRNGAAFTREQFQAALQTATGQAPDNPIVFAGIGDLKGVRLEPYASTIGKMVSRYPHSSLWNLAHARLLRERNRMVARSAPQSSHP